METHLFFARIMKEHSLFLEAGFPCCEKDFINEAAQFRQKFEELLEDVLKIADGHIHEPVLKSGELVTEFTLPAEKRTASLSGIPIDTRITEKTRLLLRDCSCSQTESRPLLQPVVRINERALGLIRDLIRFKECILNKIDNGTLFTANYPLLIEHIIREAKLYRDIVIQLLTNRNMCYRNFYETEEFWNQIMMEHAWFIRGLLDPSEEKLIETADDFSKDYARLLDMACSQDRRANSLTERTLKETIKYRDFKAAGAEGILNGQIASIILPLLAEFEIAAVQAKITYNRYGWHDPQGRFFVLKEDLETHGGLDSYIRKVEEQKIRVEPLVIRANAGDCIEFRFTNLLPDYLEESPFQMETLTDIVGHHVHLVKFDTVVSDGAANGWNNIAGARQYETLIERFFADTELRTVFFHDHLFANSHQMHGMFGAMIIEEAGATFHSIHSGSELRRGTQAVIRRRDGTSFREFALFVHNFAFLFDKKGIPLNPPEVPGSHDDPGVMGINYRCEPMPERLKNGEDPAYNLCLSRTPTGHSTDNMTRSL